MTFIFEGMRGEGLSMQALQGWCNAAPEQGSDSPSSDFPLKKNFESEPNRCLFRAGEHVPTSSPEPWSSAPTFIFEGVRGEGPSALPAQEDPPSPQGQVSPAPSLMKRAVPQLIY